MSRNKRVQLILALLLCVLLLYSAQAVPNSINIQGKLTSSSGTLQVGTQSFTFRLYDNSTNGTKLYEKNISALTDSRGIYDVILKDINLPFDQDYFLGISVNGDSEMTPRVNLTSSPYSLGANRSFALNTSEDVVLGNVINISKMGNILANGSIQAGSLRAKNQLDIGGGFGGGGATIESDGDILTQGDIIFSGNITIVNISTISSNGSMLPAIDNAFDLGNATYRWRNANFSGIVHAATIYADTILSNSLFSTWNRSGTRTFLANINDYVGIGTSTPDVRLEVKDAQDTELIRLSDSTNGDSVGLFTGFGNPEGQVSAQQGSLYMDHASGSVYRKDSDIGAADWVELASGGSSSAGNSTAHLAKITRNAAQSISSGTLTQVQFDSINFSAGITPDITSAYSINITKAGKYLASAAWGLNSTLDDQEQLQLFIYKNGQAIARDIKQVSGAADSDLSVEATAILDLKAGDYLQMFIQHQEGATLNTNITESLRPTLSIAQLDPSLTSAGGWIRGNGTVILDDATFNVSANTLHIDNTNNRIGIRTTAPQYVLQVANASGGRNVNLSDVLYVQGSRVGIGTTLPTSIFDVSYSDINTAFGSSSTARGLQIINRDITNNNLAQLLFRTEDVSANTETGAEITAIFTNHAESLVDGDLAFLTNGVGGLTEKMRIMAEGNIGIGTSSPGRKLEVAGSINGTQLNISGTANLAYGGGNVGIGTSSAQEKLIVIGNVNISGTLNVSGRVAFPNIASQNCLGTDANGVLQAGSCGTSSSTSFNRENVTEYLGGSGINASILKVSNISGLLQTVESVFNLNNLTQFLGGNNDTIVRFSNLSSYQSEASAFKIANLTGYLGDNASIVRTNNLSAYQVEASAFKIGNLTGYLGDNASIVRTSNLSVYQIESSAFKIGNATALFGTNESNALWNRSGNSMFPRNISAKIGIGTTTPSVKLEIRDNEDSEFIRLTDSTNGDTVGLFTGSGTPEAVVSAQRGSIYLDQAGGVYVKTIDGGSTGWTLLTVLIPGSQNSTSWNKSGSRVFLANITDKVGIGTITPSQQLEIVGHLNATGVSSNSTFEGDVRVKGLLSGASPLKISGGINISGVASGDDSFFIINGSGEKIFSIDRRGKLNLSENSGNVSIDGNTFFVDTLNNRIGVGTSNPAQALVIVGSVNITSNLNVSGVVQAQQYLGDGGLLTGLTVFRIENLTGYLGDNASIVRTSNLSVLQVEASAFKIGNLTGYLGDNASIVRTDNLSVFQKEASAFKIGNLTGYLGDNASIVRAGNLSVLQVEASAFKIGNLTGYLGDNATIVRASNLSVFQIEANSFKIANLTGYLGDNASIVRAGNLSVLQVEASAFKIANATAAIASTNQSVWNQTSGSIFLKDQNKKVGIGVDNPAQALVVVGSVNVTRDVNVSGMVEASQFKGDGSLLTGISTNFPLGWVNLTNYPAACSGDDFVVGIGDTLICNDIGIAASTAGGWTNNSADTFTSRNVIVEGGLFIVNTSTDRVGIGTSMPGRLFEVAGSMNATQLNISGNTNLAYGSGNVGIGTSTAQEKLIVIGNVNVSGTLNVSGKISFPNLAGAACITVASDGTLQTGTCSGSGASVFNRENVSEFLGGSDVNASLIKAGNLSTVLAPYQVESSSFKRANVSEYLGGSDVNASLIKTGNLSTILSPYQIEGSAFKRVNVSEFLGGSDVNASLIKSGNLSTVLSPYQVEASAFKRVNLSEFLGGSDVNASLIKTGNLSTVLAPYQVESASFKRVNVSEFLGGSDINSSIIKASNVTAWDTGVADDFNYATNLTGILGPNSSILRTANLTNGVCIALTGSAALCDGVDDGGSGGSVGGIGSAGNITYWTGSSTVGNSTLFQSSGRIGIGTVSPQYAFQIGDNSSKAVNLSNTLFVDGSTGFVGIGNNSPGRALQVVGVGSFHYGSDQNKYLRIGSDATGGYLEGDPSGNPISFYTFNGGSEGERLRITGTGNIGIATTSPAYLLQVANVSNGKNVNLSDVLYVQGKNVGIGTSSPSYQLHLDSRDLNYPSIGFTGNNQQSTGTIQYEGGTGYFYYDAGAGPGGHAFRTSGTSLMTILGSGKVGINTSAPAEKLVVIGNVNISGTLNVSGTVAFPNLAGASCISVASDGTLQSASCASGSSSVSGVGNSGNITYWTGSGSLGNSTLFQSSGKIGIGTTAPTNDLTINGSLGVNITNTGSGDSFVVNDASGDTSPFVITGAGNVGIGIANPSYVLQVLGGSIDVNSDTYGLRFGAGDAEITHSSYDLLFSTYTGAALTEKIRLTSGGNVGIGTIAPLATLHVNGTGAQGGFRVTNDSGLSVLFVNSTSANVMINTPVPVNNAALTVNPLAGQEGIRNQGSSAASAFYDITDYTYVVDPANTATSGLFAGKIGIGTTAPLSTLHVNGSGAQGGLKIQNDSGYTTFFVNSSNGLVGIGTGAPTGRLHIITTNDIDPDIASAFDSTGVVIGSITEGLMFNYDQTNNRAFIASVTPGSSWGNLILAGQGGNVGIGTTTPARPLDVNGIIRGTELATDGSSSQILKQYLSTWDNQSYVVSYGFTSELGDYVNLSHGGNGATNKEFIISESKGFSFIDGNVGIGTTSPQYLLQVANVSGGKNVNLSDVLYVQGNRVGIGTISPTFQLEVFAPGTQNATRFGNSQSNIDIGGDGSRAFINTESWALGLQTAGTDRVYITNGGNVGIGTTSPNSKLAVSGSGDQVVSVISTSNGNTKLNLTPNGGGVGEVITTGSHLYLTSTNNDIVLLPNGATAMTIKNGGNVGIGTTVPQFLLQIADGSKPLNVSNFLFVNGSRVGIGTNAPDTMLQVMGNISMATGALSGPRAIGIENAATNFGTNTGGSAVLFDNIAGGSDEIAFHTHSAGVSAGERMRIDKSGNLGIGSVSPGKKLEVSDATDSVWIDPSARMPTINTTSPGGNAKNLSIASEDGSVIIQLG